MTPIRPWALLPYIAVGFLALHEARSIVYVGGSSTTFLAHWGWGAGFTAVAGANLGLASIAERIADVRALRVAVGALTILIYTARAAAIAIETDLPSYPQQAGFGRTLALVILAAWAYAAPLRHPRLEVDS